MCSALCHSTLVLTNALSQFEGATLQSSTLLLAHELTVRGGSGRIGRSTQKEEKTACGWRWRELVRVALRYGLF
jgi:hypothetical protein